MIVFTPNMEEKRILICFICISLPIIKCAMPGLFFWKPRVGLQLAYSSGSKGRVNKPTIYNIESGYVVLIEGYHFGITIITLILGINDAKVFHDINPISAYFYTNVYRWMLRYLDLIPVWLTGRGGTFYDTHKVWRRRFYYMGKFVPLWMRRLFPYVKKEEWEKEKREFALYLRYIEPAFAKHYRYPSKQFNNFWSDRTYETIEGMDESSLSLLN